MQNTVPIYGSKKQTTQSILTPPYDKDVCGVGRKWGGIMKYVAKKFYSELKYIALDCQGYHVIKNHW